MKNIQTAMDTSIGFDIDFRVVWAYISNEFNMVDILG